MRGSHAALAAVLVLAACAPRTVRPRATVLGTPGDVDAVVRLALTLDAAGDRAGDTLYAPDGVVVANAQVRLAPPRYAGVTAGGRLTVTAASVSLQGRLAWVLVDYRWVNTARRLAEAGRATFVCELRGSSWRIVHAHSSQLLPWDR